MSESAPLLNTSHSNVPKKSRFRLLSSLHLCPPLNTAVLILSMFCAATTLVALCAGPWLSQTPPHSSLTSLASLASTSLTSLPSSSSSARGDYAWSPLLLCVPSSGCRSPTSQHREATSTAAFADRATGAASTTAFLLLFAFALQALAAAGMASSQTTRTGRGRRAGAMTLLLLAALLLVSALLAAAGAADGGLLWLKTKQPHHKHAVRTCWGLGLGVAALALNILAAIALGVALWREIRLDTATVTSDSASRWRRWLRAVMSAGWHGVREAARCAWAARLASGLAAAMAALQLLLGVIAEMADGAHFHHNAIPFALLFAVLRGGLPHGLSRPALILALSTLAMDATVAAIYARDVLRWGTSLQRTAMLLELAAMVLKPLTLVLAFLTLRRRRRLLQEEYGVEGARRGEAAGEEGGGGAATNVAQPPLETPTSAHAASHIALPQDNSRAATVGHLVPPQPTGAVLSHAGAGEDEKNGLDLAKRSAAVSSSETHVRALQDTRAAPPPVEDAETKKRRKKKRNKRAGQQATDAPLSAEELAAALDSSDFAMAHHDDNDDVMASAHVTAEPTPAVRVTSTVDTAQLPSIAKIMPVQSAAVMPQAAAAVPLQAASSAAPPRATFMAAAQVAAPATARPEHVPVVSTASPASAGEHGNRLADGAPRQPAPPLRPHANPTPTLPTSPPPSPSPPPSEASPLASPRSPEAPDMVGEDFLFASGEGIEFTPAQATSKEAPKRRARRERMARREMEKEEATDAVAPLPALVPVASRTGRRDRSALVRPRRGQSLSPKRRTGDEGSHGREDSGSGQATNLAAASSVGDLRDTAKADSGPIPGAGPLASKTAAEPATGGFLGLFRRRRSASTSDAPESNGAGTGGKTYVAGPVAQQSVSSGMQATAASARNAESAASRAAPLTTHSSTGLRRSSSTSDLQAASAASPTRLVPPRAAERDRSGRSMSRDRRQRSSSVERTGTTVSGRRRSGSLSEGGPEGGHTEPRVGSDARVRASSVTRSRAGSTVSLGSTRSRSGSTASLRHTEIAGSNTSGYPCPRCGRVFADRIVTELHLRSCARGDSADK